MLSAPHHPTPTPPWTRPEQTIRPARIADLWRIAVGHSRAATARSRRPARCFLALAPVVTALRLFGSVGRGEVWTCGVGTAVVMTPTPPRRPRASVAVLTVTVHGVVVVIVPAMLAAATAGIAGPVAAVGPVVAIGWLTGLLLPLLATVHRSRRADAIPMVRAGRNGQTVRLHDLARHPADPAGTGAQLLAAVLTNPIYRDDTVVTVAASPRLADLYTASGMTLQRARPTGEGVV